MDYKNLEESSKQVPIKKNIFLLIIYNKFQGLTLEIIRLAINSRKEKSIRKVLEDLISKNDFFDITGSVPLSDNNLQYFNVMVDSL